MFLSSSTYPEIHGFLHAKEQGKKSWKKVYFFLRRSGLYFSTKGTSKVSQYLWYVMNYLLARRYQVWLRNGSFFLSWCPELEIYLNPSHLLKYFLKVFELTLHWFYLFCSVRGAWLLLFPYQRHHFLPLQTNFLGLLTNLRFQILKSNRIFSFSFQKKVFILFYTCIVLCAWADVCAPQVCRVL